MYSPMLVFKIIRGLIYSQTQMYTQVTNKQNFKVRGFAVLWLALEKHFNTSIQVSLHGLMSIKIIWFIVCGLAVITPHHQNIQ